VASLLNVFVLIFIVAIKGWPMTISLYLLF